MELGPTSPATWVNGSRPVRISPSKSIASAKAAERAVARRPRTAASICCSSGSARSAPASTAVKPIGHPARCWWELHGRGTFTRRPRSVPPYVTALNPPSPIHLLPPAGRCEISVTQVENRRRETAAFRDYTVVLWLLKLGALPNLYFLSRTATANADPWVVVPARIFFAVSLYRCLFPVRYEHNVVLHDSRLSSIFATRVLATFAEVAYIFLLARVLRVLN